MKGPALRKTGRSFFLCYTRRSQQHYFIRTWAGTMKAERLEHFRQILLAQLREHAPHIREEQAAANDFSQDDLNDTTDISVMDINKEMAFSLGERESQLVADIDQALLRIDEGTYGICARCGHVIDERRLEAMPTARYDANCQAMIEAQSGLENPPTL
jgi:RNA polymerase-binding transcription factor